MRSSLRLGAGIVAIGAVGTLAGCDLPFGLGLPTTRSLESGAATTLNAATSYEIVGSYSEGSNRWTIDLQVDRSGSEHAFVKTSSLEVEARILGSDAYFRGQQFLSAHMGKDPISRAFVRAAGDGWWKGSVGNVPKLTDLTDGTLLRSTFLGQAVNQRVDGLSVDGVGAVELSGPRADVFIAAEEPHQVLRVRLKRGVTVDGIEDADLRYRNYNDDFQIWEPLHVIDFSNLSRLPPLYTVVSVDNSGCGSPCTVSALVKNLGGLVGAQARSSVTFTMTDRASGQVVGNCQADIQPDVGYNATTTVACTMPDLVTLHGNAFRVSAVPDNPGGR